jgi:superfamily II RNA helicase
MVFVCNTPFNTIDYSTVFAKFASFPLSDFQKWAIKAIIEGNHALITAHTGSGKTLPAEFMINHFTVYAEQRKEKRKRIIYASPIKALSNQKLYDLRAKYPDISFGILTGDCKDNPEADVLIVTTEILRNTLFNKRISGAQDKQLPLAFDINLDDLAGVIFDEVHYINDAERGSIWEQSIMLLPPHVQILMLSATIANSTDFANWVETEKNKQAIKENTNIVKQVILASTTHRVVPLTHYMWCHTLQSSQKKLQDNQKAIQSITKFANRLVPLKKDDGTLCRDNMREMRNLCNTLDYNYLKPRRSAVINSLISHLKHTKKLPAICFVFSRRHVEIIANEITQNLFETNDTVPSIIEKECRKILSQRLTNYKEYLNLPEYTNMIRLLQRGIAIHHAGVISVLREMIELLFEKGWIKLLIATETFAVGINMPTKTVIFSSVNKYDGHDIRPLYSHEYTQMAGRAGRRGIDTMGDVVHCSNLIDIDSIDVYPTMLCGEPQKLTSKFTISYGLLLNVIASGQSDTSSIEQFVKHSMLGKELEHEAFTYKKTAQTLHKKVAELTKLADNTIRTPTEILTEYQDLIKDLNNQYIRLKPKARKNKERIVQNIVESHKHILEDIKMLDTIYQAQDSAMNEDLRNVECIEFFKHAVNDMTLFLIDEGFIQAINMDNTTITDNPTDNLQLTLTRLGRAASQLQEVHPLAVAKTLIDTNYFETWCVEDIVAFLAMFVQIRVSDDKRTFIPETQGEKLVEDIERYADIEAQFDIKVGVHHDINFDLVSELREWCKATNEADCITIIEKVKAKDISLGDFIKAILKINNISTELSNIAEAEEQVTLLWKLSHIPELTLKYVVTNQSLYI